MQGVALIEAVFRAERARVLATTIRATHGDFDLAEEVVQDAFSAAVSRWPVEGTPKDPLAWLIAVARNKSVDAIRRRIKLREILSRELAEEEGEEQALAAVPDDRLSLIFTCCHPALARDAQVALTLRTLGGLTTEEIARAFLTSPVTMAQRIVRAKNKITAAGIPYRVPEATELPERTASVMSVIYLIFNEGYAATAGDAWIRRDLCREAIRLGRLLRELTNAPEAQGLLALMLLQDSRRDARSDVSGDLVLLEHQDRSRWDRAQIEEALTLVPPALRGGAGPYALQAAIAALHASAPSNGETDWPQIVALFDELLKRESTPVARLNYAVAVGMTRGPEAALKLIEPLREALSGYHLWHAARADMLRRLGRAEEAVGAYREALNCAGSEPEKRFLTRRIVELTQ
jgi:RNA polymerase sigma-70 factor (ECF subfamily)